jgi:hypothetical protein
MASDHEPPSSTFSDLTVAQAAVALGLSEMRVEHGIDLVLASVRLAARAVSRKRGHQGLG